MLVSFVLYFSLSTSIDQNYSNDIFGMEQVHEVNVDNLEIDPNFQIFNYKSRQNIKKYKNRDSTRSGIKSKNKNTNKKKETSKIIDKNHLLNGFTNQLASQNIKLSYKQKVKRTQLQEHTLVINNTPKNTPQKSLTQSPTPTASPSKIYQNEDEDEDDSESTPRPTLDIYAYYHIPTPSLQPEITTETEKFQSFSQNEDEYDKEDDEPMFDSRKHAFVTDYTEFNNCEAPNTVKTNSGKCSCAPGYPFGDGTPPEGCWRCKTICGGNSSCVFPGRCRCEPGFFSNAGRCFSVRPHLQKVTPKRVDSFGGTLISVRYSAPVMDRPTRVLCRMANVFEGQWFSRGTIGCVSPPSNRSELPISISFDGFSWSNSETIQYGDSALSASVYMKALILGMIASAIAFFLRVTGN